MVLSYMPHKHNNKGTGKLDPSASRRLKMLLLAGKYFAKHQRGQRQKITVEHKSKRVIAFNYLALSRLIKLRLGSKSHKNTSFSFF